MARHRSHVQLRWSDMDALRHVNNVQFLRFLEDARVADDGRGRRGAASSTTCASSSYATRSTIGDRCCSAPSRSSSTPGSTRVGRTSYALAYEVREERRRRRLRHGRHGDGLRRPPRTAARSPSTTPCARSSSRSSSTGSGPSCWHGSRGGAAPMSAELVHLAKDEAAYLAAFLGRIVGWDERSAVRVQARGGVVGVYAPSPLDVLVVHRAAARRPPADAPLDRTVSAGRLRDVIGDVARLGAETDVALPDAVTGSRVARRPAARGAVVTGRAGDGRRRGAARRRRRGRVPRRPCRAPARFRPSCVAEATWDAPGWGGVPMRALHAARLLGFLHPPRCPHRDRH